MVNIVPRFSIPGTEKTTQQGDETSPTGQHFTGDVNPFHRQYHGYWRKTELSHHSVALTGSFYSSGPFGTLPTGR